MGAKHQFIELELPPGYTGAVKEAIALEIIDTIVRRTKKGVDKDGDSFPGYSKEYVESIDFKSAGKSKGDVNLTLSGDLLDELALLSISGRKLKIGYERGSEANAKADGNIRGTYGQSSPIRGKARDFLGLTDDELEKILSKYPRDDREAALGRASKTIAAKEVSERTARGIETDLNDLEDDF